MENTIEIVELFDNLYLQDRQLTAAEMDFVNGCKKQFKKTKQLSEKQIRILKDILKFLPDNEPVRTTFIDK